MHPDKFGFAVMQKSDVLTCRPRMNADGVTGDADPAWKKAAR